jgi:DNA replication initiation complex subunit (GINS family)
MYKRILEFWLNEKEVQDLQKPPLDFKDETRKYLEDLARMENGVPSKLKLAEAERVKHILNEISVLRREKICKAAVAGTVSDDVLFDDEIGLFRPLKEPEKVAEDSAKKILVRVLRDVPSFVGADLKTYGPYKTEDVVLLPAQNAEALIKREIATEIKRRI